MKRLQYVWRLLDRRDRVVLAGMALAGLVMAGGIGHVTAAHRARVERQRDCVERYEAMAKRRGFQVVKLAALAPCETGR